MAYLADQEEVLFRKTLKYSMGFYLLLGIVLTVIQLPPLKQLDVNHLSDRVAKLILEPPKLKTPPPAVAPVLKNEGQKKVEAKPKEKPKPKAEAKKKVKAKQKIVKKEVAPPPTAEQNREIVKKSGLLASFVDDDTFGALNEIMEDNRKRHFRR